MLRRSSFLLLAAACSLTAACGGSTSSDPADTATTAGGSGGSAGGTAGTGTAGSAGKATGGAAGTGNAAGTSTAGTGGTGPFATAPHGTPPKMPGGNGKVLVSPQIVTVTWSTDTKVKEIEAFDEFVVQSSWIETTGADYGFGKGQHVGKVSITEAAPKSITDEQVQAFIEAKIADGTLPAPADPLNNDWLYMLYFPQGTSVVLDGQKGCQGFLGYHNSVYKADKHLAYAVMPRCGGGGGGGHLFFTASHEVHEAASDPYPLDEPSYRFEDQNVPWTFIGGETADVCIDLEWNEGGYSLSRVYSNSAAKADKDWCVPSDPDLPMFGVYPTPSKTAYGKPGETVSIKLTAWAATEDVGVFSLDVYPYQSTFNPQPTLSKTEAQNGEEVTLEITIPTTAKAGQDFASALVVSSRGAGDYHMWPIAVIAK